MALNLHNMTACLIREITDHLDTKDILNLAQGVAALSYVRYWVYMENILKNDSSIIHSVAKHGKVETLMIFQDIEDRMPHLDVKWECQTNMCADPKATSLLEAYNLRGWTPIHTAAYFGNEDVVTFLAKKGRGINSEDDTERKGRTPMLYAALSKNSDTMVPFMKNLGCDINQIITPNGLSLLAYLCLKKNFGAAKAVMKMGANLDYRYPGDNKNIIHLCCAYEVSHISNFKKFRRPAKEAQAVDAGDSGNDPDEDYDEYWYKKLDCFDEKGLKKEILQAITNDPDSYISDYLEEDEFWMAAGRRLANENKDGWDHRQSNTILFDSDALEDVLKFLIGRDVDATAVDALGNTPAHYAVLFPQEDAYWTTMWRLKEGGEEFLTDTEEGGTAVGVLSSEGDRTLHEGYDERITFFINSTEVSMDWIEPDYFRADWAEVAKQLQRDHRYKEFDQLRARMSMEDEDCALDGYDSYWGVGKFADCDSGEENEDNENNENNDRQDDDHSDEHKEEDADETIM